MSQFPWLKLAGVTLAFVGFGYGLMKATTPTEEQLYKVKTPFELVPFVRNVYFRPLRAWGRWENLRYGPRGFEGLRITHSYHRHRKLGLIFLTARLSGI
ncbi:hypothetical protein F5887DRAFT_934954 [Amanita rubescens]|nr:hypothetical protein F5887DRAFT_934954 [Amanita rubescens]